MGIKDNFRKGLKTIFRRTVDFLADEDEEVAIFRKTTSVVPEPIEPEPEPVVVAVEPTEPIVEQEPAEEPEAPREIVPVEYKEEFSVFPGTAEDDTGNLLQQLAESATMSNELVRRLESMGMAEEARKVVSERTGMGNEYIDDMASIAMQTKLALEQAQEAMKKALEALNMDGNVLTDTAKKMQKQAEALALSADQAAKDVQAKADEVQRKAEKLEEDFGLPPEARGADGYDWDRDNEFFALDAPANIFKKVDKFWKHIAYGVSRNAQGQPIALSKHAPRMIARSSNISKAIRVPIYAISNQAAFEMWCITNGFKDDVSVEIDGVIPGARFGSFS